MVDRNSQRTSHSNFIIRQGCIPLAVSDVSKINNDLLCERPLEAHGSKLADGVVSVGGPRCQITPCPSCTRAATRFYCADCVTHGNFVMSSSQKLFMQPTGSSPQTFSELRVKLYEHQLDIDSAVEGLFRAPAPALRDNVSSGNKTNVSGKQTFSTSACVNGSGSLLNVMQLYAQLNVVRSSVKQKQLSINQQQDVLQNYQQDTSELRRKIARLREQIETSIKIQNSRQQMKLRLLGNRKHDALSRCEASFLQLARRQKTLVVDLVTTVFCVEPAVSSPLQSNNSHDRPRHVSSDLGLPETTSSNVLLPMPVAPLKTQFFIDHYPLTSLTRIVYGFVPTQLSWPKFWLDFEENKRLSLLMSSTRDFAASSTSVHSLSSRERLLDRVFTKEDDSGSSSSSSDAEQEDNNNAEGNGFSGANEGRLPRRRHTMGSQERRPYRQLRMTSTLMPAVSVLPNPVPAALFYLSHLNRCLRNVLFLTLPGFLFNPYEVARAAADVNFANATNVQESELDTTHADGPGKQAERTGTASENVRRISQLCTAVGDTLLAICITQGCALHASLNADADYEDRTNSPSHTAATAENCEIVDNGRTRLTGLLLALVSHAQIGRCRSYSLAPLSAHQPCEVADFNDIPQSSYCSESSSNSSLPVESGRQSSGLAYAVSKTSSSGRKQCLRQASCSAAMTGNRQRRNSVEDEASDGWEKISDDATAAPGSAVQMPPATVMAKLQAPIAYSQAMNRSISSGGFMTAMSSLWKSTAPEPRK